MKRFVDTGFFIALLDRGDIHFDKARECLQSQIDDKAKLITSNMVLSETITWLRYHAGYRYAKEFGDKFRHSELVETLWVDSYIESEAWKIFLKYSDHELSYVDCLSFACMRTHQINKVLTFDKHFRQVGFVVFPH
ncbi:MAG: PIN domain-containing protein [Candidatus Margulisbacteria bacterium]|nr:PIN domain-containing protein [Candidatus Margulisiibacteriota bacterium]